MLCAEAAKEEEAEDDDDMDGFQTDDEDDEGEVSDREMGVDAEDGDEADSIKLQKLAAQVCHCRACDAISLFIFFFILFKLVQ